MNSHHSQATLTPEEDKVTPPPSPQKIVVKLLLIQTLMVILPLFPKRNNEKLPRALKEESTVQVDTDSLRKILLLPGAW